MKILILCGIYVIYSANLNRKKYIKYYLETHVLYYFNLFSFQQILEYTLCTDTQTKNIAFKNVIEVVVIMW